MGRRVHAAGQRDTYRLHRVPRAQRAGPPRALSRYSQYRIAGRDHHTSDLSHLEAGCTNIHMLNQMAVVQQL